MLQRRKFGAPGVWTGLFHCDNDSMSRQRQELQMTVTWIGPNVHKAGHRFWDLAKQPDAGFSGRGIRHSQFSGLNNKVSAVPFPEEGKALKGSGSMEGEPDTLGLCSRPW